MGGRGWGGKMEGSEAGGALCMAWVCGGSAAPCFAEARWEVSGAVLRADTMVLGVENVHNACARHGRPGRIVARQKRNA